MLIERGRLMKRKTSLTWLCISFLILTVGVLATLAGVGPPALEAIWADEELYGTVATPAQLPDKGPKDGLFVFTGLAGQRPVAESKPGDRDYNGGRWQVYVLAFTDSGKQAHDPDGDGFVNFELKSWEMVEKHINELGHLELVGKGPSFVCPLIKKKAKENLAPSRTVSSATAWGKLKSQ